MTKATSYEIEKGAKGLSVTRTIRAEDNGPHYKSPERQFFYFSSWEDARVWLGLELSDFEART